MNGNVPSAVEAFAFFAKYRKQVEEKERNEGSAVQGAAAEQTAILTQVQQQQQQQQASELRTLIPLDRTKGTPSFRLRVVRTSPKNCSPDLLKQPTSLLPAPMITAKRPITLVLDVDETLVHSSFQPKPGMTYDKELIITYNQQIHRIYVKYRPYLLDFLKFVSDLFEIVIFTASLSAYCNPLIDTLDPQNSLGNLRLFREHCTYRNNSYIKDLFLLGRDLGRIAIIDNSPTAYLFQQRNAIPIKSWFDDPDDRELLALYPLLQKLSACESVYDVLDEYNANGVVR